MEEILNNQIKVIYSLDVSLSPSPKPRSIGKYTEAMSAGMEAMQSFTIVYFS